MSRPFSSQRALRAAAIAALILVLAVFAGYFVIYAVYARSLLAFPFEYDQGEGFEVFDAIRLARGQGIYLDNAVYPFYSSNYPPVFRLMVVPLIWLFGPQVWTGRAVSLACSIAIGGLIFLASRRLLTRARPEPAGGAVAYLAPLIAALAFFAANYVYYIGPLARAHVPMVMFALAGIYVMDLGLENGAGRKTVVALGVALLLLAGFTKLQAVDALAAGFGFLLLRKPRWFLAALAASGVFTAVAVLALNAATQGQFWLNVVLANVNEYDIQRTWFFYGEWFRLQGVLIVCSVLYVAWDVTAALRARSFRPITIWSLYFAAGSAMGMLTGKWGAGPTYLVAAIAASCVCTVGLAWRVSRAAVRDSAWRASGFAALCALVFLGQAALNVHLPTSGRLFGTLARLLNIPAGQSAWPPYPYYDTIGSTQLGHLLDPADTTNGWDLVRVVREAPGPVWSEEAMWTLHAGKDVVTNPTQLLNLSKAGLLDMTEMLRMIRNQEFGAVVFRAQFYPQDVLLAIRDYYQWGKTIRANNFDYQVLYPRPGMR